MNKYKVLDMFCGAGGLSKGFIDAGYEVSYGVDFDDAALKTFEKNHTNAKGLKLNLFDDKDMRNLIEIVRKEKIDVIIGGPPCQGFSLAGKRKENDDRNKLYERMVELASIVKPKIILLENVPGLATLYDGKAKKRILEDFRKLGYNMTEPKVLYAPDYGIPQIRKRLFFVGILDGDKEFQYPKPIFEEKDYISCEDAIGDLPSLETELGENVSEYIKKPQTEYQKKMRGNNNILYNHVGTKHTEKVVSLLKMIPEGENYKALPKELVKNNTFNEYLTRYHSKKPSKTIDTGHRVHFHYKYNRVPTVRENARLQSFPDDFIFLGNKTQQYRQVGNAVPPLLGYFLGKEILKYIDKKEKV